ncbi:MAG TPA: hypothetical protein DCP03_06770 [Polaromonas sp.]|uniref:tripartite tricarboxylate transporter substrate binding protein n=1 Tax=Polaromonas sp. UBA4122 TaxID=1947074 RepID=UPI000EC21EF6|nr:tripartite tricarboxylate transporter substrate binding protein [Polaromonas sp. UBA4122]HAL37824.1 hypothetical protein [Polaromonas sp.]
MKAMIRLVCFTMLALAALMAAPGAMSQSYPDKPIHLVVGFPPGGINDIVARIVAQKLGDRVGKPVIVENRAGAGGTLGADYVAKAKPDGYTLLLGSVSNIAMAPSQYKSLPYDPPKDFEPVALVASSPNILVVNPSFPARSVKELVALAKQRPGSINYASAGNGTSNHLTVELLKTMAGIDLVHVPYKGDSAGIIDVIAGQVPMMFPTLPVALPFIKSGKLRAIAVSSANRSTLAPDVPTVDESGGLNGFAVSVWVGIFAPAATRKDIVQKLNVEIAKINQMPDVRQRFAVQGVEPETVASPAEFAAYIATETSKWSKVAKAANIVPD